MNAGETGWPYIIPLPTTVNLSALKSDGAVLMLTDPNNNSQSYPMTIGTSATSLNGVSYAANTYVWIASVAVGQFAIAGTWTQQLWLYFSDGTIRKGKAVQFTIFPSVAPPSSYAPPV